MPWQPIVQGQLMRRVMQAEGKEKASVGMFSGEFQAERFVRMHLKTRT